MHGATKPPILRSNPLLSSGHMVDPVSANTLLQVQNQHLTYKLYSTHIMHTESGERALWGRIKGCRPQFSVSPRARASCSLGAGRHFPFGTIVVDTAEKPRLSPTARLPSRKPRVRRKPALRNAQQVQRENSSVPGIRHRQVEMPRRRTAQAAIHTRRLSQLLRTSLASLGTSTCPKTPAGDCLL